MQVETYGSMDKQEKVEYILEQVRLCLEKGDFVRGAIVSKKLTGISCAYYILIYIYKCF